VAGGAAILAAATVAGVAVVNAASATEIAKPTRSVVADPVAQSTQAEINLPDVAKPSEAPAPGEPTVITVPASGNGQGGSYADDDDAEGGNKAYEDDDKAYGDEESEKHGEQYTDESSDDQYENGDDESSYADQEQGEDHEDEGEYDDDDD
jgi:hypothetical protein